MTSNLNFALEANKTYTGVNNTTGEEITFNTGNTCAMEEACIMNGNTIYDEEYNQWTYNWYAAVAGSGTRNEVNIDTPYSVCPARWRLPPNYTIDATKSYGELTDAYGFTINAQTNRNNLDYIVAQIKLFPLSFVSAHWAGGDGIGRSDYQGDYWQSTSRPVAGYAYRLYYSSVDSTWRFIAPQNNSYKRDGFSVRCITI